MELKKYQLRIRDEVEVYLTELSKHQAAGNKHAALDAWDYDSWREELNKRIEDN